MTDLKADRDEYLRRWVPSDERGDDWYEMLRYARDECPMTHSDGAGGFWFLPRHEDAVTVLRQHDLFSSAEGITIPHNPSAPPMPPIDVDPPLQRHFRRLIGPALTPATIARHEPKITAFADMLIDRFVDDGGCEFMGAFARPFPAFVLADLILGVDDPDLLLEIQEKVEPIGSDVGSEAAGKAWVYLREQVTALLAERRERPPDDSLLSTLVHGEVDDRPLTEGEQIGTAMILVLGGLNTTTDAFGNVVLRAAADPSLEAELRKPDWALDLLDEFLRLDSPVQYVGRTVTRPTEIGGVALQPGEVVMAHLGSGNRDDRTFDRPDELCPGRAENKYANLSFGMGVHRCVGMHLARTELRIGFERLLARVTNFRLADPEAITFLSGMSCGPSRLPVTFDRAAGSMTGARSPAFESWSSAGSDRDHLGR